jgi:single-strand DNA-binding protein
MNESYVTLQGWVGGEVDVRMVGETQCASFRVGSTPRYNKGGTWVDGQTSWFTVNCWRGLGRNVADSIRRGDAVVVHGRVRVDVWEREGQPSSVTWIVDATFVGHDLNRGTSSFEKTSRAATTARDPREDEAVREVVHAYQPDGPQLDEAGQPVSPAA